MGHISIKLDANATIALTTSLKADLGREPTNTELWSEIVRLLQGCGSPPESPRAEKADVLEYEVLVR